MFEKAIKLKNKGFFHAFLWLSFFLFPLMTFASSEIFPVKEIVVQAFNFSIFFFLFVFLLRKPIKQFFSKRQEDFLFFEKQAFQREKQKKEEHKKWQEKLERLNQKEKGITKEAEVEGQKIIFLNQKKLKNLKDQLQTEADFFIHLETKKIKTEIFEKWRNKVIERAELELGKQGQSEKFQVERYKDFFKQMESHI